MIAPPAAPQRYTPSVEEIQPDEEQVQAELVEQLLKISRITYEDGHKALRSVHAKSHGLLEGTFTVAADLPTVLAQGLFASPGSYRAVARLSTSPGDLLPDSVSTPRGFALKLFDVPGERLAESEAQTTQDFLLVTGKAFLTPDAAHFLRSLKLLAATTDTAPGLKTVLSRVLRSTESALEAVGGESGTLKALGGYPETHILGESFFSQVPLRYGDYIAKVGLVPASPALTALIDAPLELDKDPDALRHAVRDFFARESAAWDFRVQLCADIEAMPVEDASMAWDEAKSPYITVARLEFPRQDSWDEDRQRTLDDGTAFSPWNGLVAHRPLGSIMRARRTAYPASARFRMEKNGCPFGSA